MLDKAYLNSAEVGEQIYPDFSRMRSIKKSISELGVIGWFGIIFGFLVVVVMVVLCCAEICSDSSDKKEIYQTGK